MIQNVVEPIVIRRTVHWFMILSVMLLVHGCGKHGVGSLLLKSQASPEVFLVGGFTTRLYHMDDQNNLTLLLLDGPVDDPVQVLTIRMFWKPRAGRTPIDPTATNATIYYTIFSGNQSREVGIYSGAGFVYPAGQLGEPTFSASIWQATLRLTDRSTQFKDLLGAAILEGEVTAKRDDATVDRLLNQLRILISQKIGYPRSVNGTHQEQPASLTARGMLASQAVTRRLKQPLNGSRRVERNRSLVRIGAASSGGS